MRLTVVVGNPKPQSRTLGTALALADVLEAEIGAPERVVVDLATVGSALLDRASDEVRALTNAVVASDMLVVASPTYKASYTGLLKIFLDSFAADALAGTLTVPLMTGGSLRHALAPEVHLRPVLVELGAPMPTRSVYLDEQGIADPESVFAAWAAVGLPQVRRALGRNIHQM